MSGSEIPLIYEGYNDQVDSIDWDLPPTKTLMCHDEYPAGRKALPLIDSGYYASQLAAHNAHVSASQGWLFWWQQNMSLLEQLDYGARCLQIDIDEHNGQLFLMHGSWSASLAARAGVPPEPIGPALQAMRNWLDAHPSEVLLIDVQNDAGAPATNALAASPLAPLFYVPTGLHWPSINELVALGKRVIVFNSASSGVGQLDCYEWRVENGYSGLWTSTPRSESDDIDRKNRSFFFMNNISGTSTPTSWFGNSPNDRAPLLAHALSFGQTPSLIGIDGIEMADHAGLEVCRAVNQLGWGPLPQAAAYRMHDSCGAAQLTVVSKPALGGTLKVDGGPFHVTVLGLSDTSLNGLPLPAAVPGITTCSLRVSVDQIYLSNAIGTTSIPIPSLTAALGVTLFLQGAELTGSNWPLTNGVAARIGF